MDKFDSTYYKIMEMLDSSMLMHSHGDSGGALTTSDTWNTGDNRIAFVGKVQRRFKKNKKKRKL